MYEYKVSISSVHDGDTLRADVDLGFGVWISDQSFRLTRINAPELVKGQAAGLESKKFLAKLLPVGSIALIKTHKDKTEKYGRMLADVYFEDGRCVNDLMVENNMAKYWDGSGVRPI